MISAANFKNIGLIRSGPGDLVTSKFFKRRENIRIIDMIENKLCCP